MKQNMKIAHLGVEDGAMLLSCCDLCMCMGVYHKCGCGLTSADSSSSSELEPWMMIGESVNTTGMWEGPSVASSSSVTSCITLCQEVAATPSPEGSTPATMTTIYEL